MTYPNFNGVFGQAEHYRSINPMINGVGVFFPATALGAGGATETIDFAKGHWQSITLDQNCTVTFLDPPGPTSQVQIMLFVTQGGVGSFQLIWPGATVFPGGIRPVLSTVAGRKDLLLLQYLNGTWVVQQRGINLRIV
jgi:hypothetical protein